MDDPHRDYEQLIAPIQTQMIQSVWRITGRQEDAEEAFQEALMSIWKRWWSIRRHPNPRALILRICANAAYDVVRARIRQQRQQEPGPLPEDVPDSTQPVLERLSGQEQESAVFEAIGHLSRNQGQAFLMRVVQELSYGEIAAALNCREVTVRKHLARARAKLRVLLSPLIPSVAKEAALNE
jgi:RNA polymerase sigma factor (sigma-70 family)